MPDFLSRLGWFSMRVLILAMAVLSIATFSLGAHVLAPLYTWVLYRDLRFWRHLHALSRVSAQAGRLGMKLIREPGYRRMTSFMSAMDWLGPPRTGPDPALVAARRDWAHGEASCGDCGRCCTDIGCPSFDPDTSLCASFDSPFWRYFPCGRYPATQAQIDFYRCPKWVLAGQAEPGAAAAPALFHPAPFRKAS